MVRRKGIQVGEHRFRRIYRELALQVRPRRKRKVNFVRGNVVPPRWGAERKIHLHFIAPGKPTQNAAIESLNGKIRDELFNMHRFMTIFEARRAAADWLHDYNEIRPRSALGYQLRK